MGEWEECGLWGASRQRSEHSPLLLLPPPPLSLPFPFLLFPPYIFLLLQNRNYDIIQKYGRFPDRNDILGREHTPEEMAYLGITSKSKVKARASVSKGKLTKVKHFQNEA